MAVASGPSRRDFVVGLLGAGAVATLGCGGAGARGDRPIAGTLRDTGMARGHAAIRTPRPVPADAPRRTAEVVIVGGGAAGLSAAWRLRRLGVRDVVVLELGDEVGGTALGGTSAATPMPWGAHYIVAPQREQAELLELLADLGALEGTAPDGAPIVDEALRCREPEERLFYRGAWTAGLYLSAGASNDDIAQLRAFHAELDRLVAWRDARGRRAFALPSAAATDDAEILGLDRLSFAAWLDERGLTSPRLRWLCDYGCRDDFGLRLEATSAWAGLGYFVARQRAPGDEPQGVVTWPDGNAALIRHLAAGVRVETGAVVVDVDDAAAGGGASVGLWRGDRAEWIDARAAIVATPRFIARRLVRGLRDRVEPGLDVGAWVVANLHLRERPRRGRRDAAPAWDNVLYDSASLGYVSATHQAGRDRGPTVWTWYYPLTDEDPAVARARIAGASHADWVEVVLADLGRAHRDLRPLVTQLDVAFWGHGMVRPRVGARVDPGFAARRQPIGAVHVAHTDLSGVALFEEAFDHGCRAAREVAARLRA